MSESYNRETNLQIEATIMDVINKIIISNTECKATVTLWTTIPILGPVKVILDDVVRRAGRGRGTVKLRGVGRHACLGTEVRNNFGDLVGWLDPEATPAIRAIPLARATRIIFAACRGIKKAGRVFCCCSQSPEPGSVQESPLWPTAAD